MAEFEIVPADEFPLPGHRSGRKPSEVALALERGEVVFVTERMVAIGIGTKGGYLRHRGYRVQTRTQSRNGVAGWYLRAVKDVENGAIR